MREDREKKRAQEGDECLCDLDALSPEVLANLVLVKDRTIAKKLPRVQVSVCIRVCMSRRVCKSVYWVGG